ncbi:MFS transporter [Trueperella pyogenes]
MTSSAYSRAKLLKARRLMIVGLIASVFGNHVVNAGFNALAASGTIAVSALVVLKTIEQIIVFAFPLYARIVGKISPDKALIGVDLTEAGMSAIALTVTLFRPDLAIACLFTYVLLDALIAPVSDLADKFYGAAIANVDEKAALAFNATFYSWLAFLGFVIGGPIGSFFASISVEALLLTNVILSLSGAGLRAFARTTFAVQLIVDVDDEEYTVTGTRLPVKEFLVDLFASGPASPLLSLLIRIASAMTGELFLLWVAGVSAERSSHMNAFSGMGLVLAVFGVGAMIGPMAGRWLRKISSTRTILLASALFSGAILSLFAIIEVAVGAPFVLALTFVLAVTILNRARLVVLETFRQTEFTGTRFVRIMSWSYSFGALGTILGLQIGHWLHLSSQPVACLFTGAALWIFIGKVVNLQIKIPK